MTNASRPAAGDPMPVMAVPRVGGGEILIGDAPGWQAVFVYRGSHCPLCRHYLASLNEQADAFRGLGIGLAAVSADTRLKAETEVAEEGWRFPVGYDLSLEQMRALGLYISAPRSPSETDRPFAEPALFVANPDHRMHIIELSNAPAARPALPLLLLGLRYVLERRSPPRGTLR